MTNIRQYLILLRPHQWIKNLFIFMPLFFASKLTDTRNLYNSVVAFGAFCAIASAVYIFNDYKDMEADRKHPGNSARPIASGAIDTKNALILMLVLAIGGIGTYYLFHFNALPYLCLYIALNILYTLKLKHVPILDVMLISFGFVIRILIGSIVSMVPLSMWIVIMTFLLALFLALAKRRNDVLIYLESGEKMRKSVDGYNVEFLNSSMVIMAAVVIVAYILYTVSPEVQNKMHSDKLYLTSFFVVLGILRYMQLTIVENNGGSPTRVLLQDRFLQLVLLGWFAVFSSILYFK